MNVLVFRELPDDQLNRIGMAHAVTLANSRISGQLAPLRAPLPEADAMIGSSYPINAALLDAAPRLRVISSISVGVDNDLLADLRARGIMLCHTHWRADRNDGGHLSSSA